MENAALVPSDSSPSFAQQGTLDWTQLAKSSVSLSLEVLSRLNQAGVETFTLAVGQAVFSPFLILPDTQRKIQSTLAGLKPFSSYGNILWFGFGIKHVVRLLAESEQGVACVALCGGLSVSYDKFYCAQVLRSMLELQSAPSHLRPSISQWSNLIDVCSGTLTTSDFPNIVEGFCRLWHDKELGYLKRRGATSPAALAKALAILSAVSGGALHSATFAGGPDCAWVAALAEWALCLTVEVLDAETGQCLYRKLGDARHDAPQVRILRTFDVQSSMLQVQDKTCFLPSGAEILRKGERTERSFAGGRSTWDSILADSFPSGILQRLFSAEAAPAFSNILHHAAEKMEGEMSEAQSVLSRLPELKIVTAHSPPENQTIEEAVYVIRRVCFCPSCGGPAAPRDYCVTGLAKAILEYLWLLCRLHLHEDILPSPSGLRHLYSIYRDPGPYQFRNPRLEDRPENSENILIHILQIMTGTPYQGEPNKYASALSSSGIAVCCSSLLDPASNPVKEPSFHVVPGHIQKDDVIFHEVCDLNTNADRQLNGYPLPHLNFDDMARLTVCNSGRKPALKFLVSETLDGQKLQASYAWANQNISPSTPGPKDHHPKTDLSLTLAFGSAQLQHRLFAGASFPRCKGRQIQVKTTSNKSLSGICSQLAQKLATEELPDGARPRPGQFILLDVRSTQRNMYRRFMPPAKMYMGSITELYSILCSFGAGSAWRIVQVCASGCLFCTSPEEASGIVVVSGTTPAEGVLFARDIEWLKREYVGAGGISGIVTGTGTQALSSGVPGPTVILANRPHRGRSF